MAKSFDGFYTQVQPDQKLGVECIDDRGYLVARDAVRIAAGPFGLAKDSLSALSIEGNTEATRVPLGVMAAHVAHDLSRHNFEAQTHVECAAELGATAVASLITDEVYAQETRERAGYLLGRDISTKELSGSQRYYAQFDGVSAHYGGSECEAQYMHDHGVERAELAYETHASGLLVSNHREGTIFQTQQAYEAGAPHYTLDIWAMKRYAEALSGRLPVSLDAIMASTALRHAAITQALPNPNGGKGVDIALRAA